jgi:hypothetical protein
LATVASYAVLNHPNLKAILRFLPGIVALSLAFVYVVGSVNAAGSLARDGIAVAAVRLFTLEQLLVRGVSVLTQPELVFVALIFVGLAWLTNTPLLRSTGKLDSLQLRRGKFALPVAAALSFACGVAVLLFSPWRVAAIMAVSATIWLVLGGLFWHQDHGIRAQRRNIVVTIALLASFLVANYFAGFPQPLARLHAKRPSAKATGVLVTHANGTWYIAEDDQIESVSDADVEAAKLTFRTQESSPSLASLILDTLP